MKILLSFAITSLIGSITFADVVTSCPAHRQRNPLGPFAISNELADPSNMSAEAVTARAEVDACRRERENFNNPQRRDDIETGLLAVLNSGSFGPAGSWVVEGEGDAAMIVYQGPDNGSDLNVDELESRARSIALNVIPGGLRRFYSSDDRSGWGWDIREIGQTPERRNHDDRSETGIYTRVHGAPKLRRGLGIALVYRN